MLSRSWVEQISWQYNPDSGEGQMAWHMDYKDLVTVPSSWLTAVDLGAIATILAGVKIF